MAKFTFVLLLSAGVLSAGPITYNVDLTIGAGSVTGFIETDGTIGVLSSSNILNWDLLLNDGTTTFTLEGPLSGDNSGLGLEGSDLSATSTQLLFNYSGTDYGYALFQAPEPGSGMDWFCPTTTLDCSAGVVGNNLKITGTQQTTALTGTQAIGNVGGVVPEPSALGLATLGVAFLSFWKRRASC